MLRAEGLPLRESPVLLEELDATELRGLLNMRLCWRNLENAEERLPTEVSDGPEDMMLPGPLSAIPLRYVFDLPQLPQPLLTLPPAVLDEASLVPISEDASELKSVLGA